MVSGTMATSEWIQFFKEAGIPPGPAVNYAVTFVDNRIQKTMLLDLNKEIMNELGITVVGDIIAILKHAKVAYRQEMCKAATESLNPNNSTVGQAELRRSANSAASRMIANSLSRESPAAAPPRARPHAPKISVTVSNKMAATKTEEAAALPAKRRRVTAEMEGKYVITMPRGTTPRTRRILEQQAARGLQRTSVFERLGAEADAAAGGKPTGVFSRLGGTLGTDGDRGAESDDDDDDCSVLPYAGVLKKPGRALGRETAGAGRAAAAASVGSSPAGAGSSPTGAGSSPTGAGSSPTGAGSSPTGAGSSATGVGSRSVGSSPTGVGSSTGVGSRSVGSRSVESTTIGSMRVGSSSTGVGSRSVGSTTIGSTRVGSMRVGSSTGVGSRSVGSMSVESTTIGSRSIGSTSVGSTRVGSSTIGSTRVGSTTIESTSVGSRSVESRSVGSTRVGSTRVESTTIGSRSVGSTRVGSTTVGSTTIGSTTIGSTSVGSRSVGSRSIGSTSVGSTRVGSTSVGSTTIGSTTIGSTTIGSRSVGSMTIKLKATSPAAKLVTIPTSTQRFLHRNIHPTRKPRPVTPPVGIIEVSTQSGAAPGDDVTDAAERNPPELRVMVKRTWGCGKISSTSETPGAQMDSAGAVSVFQRLGRKPD